MVQYAFKMAAVALFVCAQILAQLHGIAALTCGCTDPATWHNGSTWHNASLLKALKTETIAECCSACAAYTGPGSCDGWVWQVNPCTRSNWM